MQYSPSFKFNLNATTQIVHLEFFSFSCVPTGLCSLTALFLGENGQNFMTEGSNPSLLVQGGLSGGLPTAPCHDGVPRMRYWPLGAARCGQPGGALAVVIPWALWLGALHLPYVPPSAKRQEVLCPPQFLLGSKVASLLQLPPQVHTPSLLGFHVTPKYPFSSYCPFVVARWGL